LQKRINWAAPAAPGLIPYTQNDICELVHDLITRIGLGTRDYIVGQLQVCEPVDPRGFGKMWRETLELFDKAAASGDRPNLTLVVPQDMQTLQS
jgi:hypothetical protein